MSFVPLDLESLANIDDGQVGLLVRRQLQQACRDCVDRPTDTAWRKVTLQLDFRPVADGRDLKHIEWLTQVKTTIPKFITAPAIAKASPQGFKVLEESESTDAEVDE